MLFLNELWAGNISPGEGRFLPNREYSKTLETMEHSDDTLKAHLSTSDYQIFREYADASLSLTCIEAEQNFIEGFRLGVRMMIDVLADCAQS